jgi:hypothetical protein
VSPAYIVVLEYHDGKELQYLADWEGDPGRTSIRESAKQYASRRSATYGLAAAMKYRNFPTARVVRYDNAE